MKKTIFWINLVIPSLKKILKTILPLLLGVFLIWYSISGATPQERATLWRNITTANPLWIAISLSCSFLSHLSRAYRWNYLLEPLGHTISLKNSFMALMMGYLANLGIPRSGEVLRAGTAQTYSHIPFEKSFGTIITERIVDLIMLLIIVLIGLLLQAELVLSYFESNHINPLLPLLIIGIGFVILMVTFKLLKGSSNAIVHKILEMIKGMVEGIKSITKMQNKLPFILHTLFIWFMYLVMFYIMKFTVAETSTLGAEAILLAFIAGAFAVSTTNGGIGVYPIAVGLVLSLYGISKENGEAMGWIIWGSQTLFNLVIGGLSFMLIPLLNSKKIT